MALGMGRGPIVAVEGPSGVGKSTLVAGLGLPGRIEGIEEAYRLTARPLRLRYHGERELDRIERRLYLLDRARWQRAARRARSGRTVVLDTGPLGTITYTWGLVRLGLADPVTLARAIDRFDADLDRGVMGLPDGVLFLVAPAATRRKRVEADPVGHRVGDRQRFETVGRLEQRLWNRAWGPLLGRRWGRLSAAGTAAEVRAEARRRLARFGSDRPGRSAAGDRALWARMRVALLPGGRRSTMLK